MIRWFEPCLLLAGLASTLFTSGCGASSEPQRQPLRGSVTVNGTSVERGSITFRPAAGHAAPAAVAPIVGGSYRFDRGTGPLPGPYHVKVNIDPVTEGDSKNGGPEPVGPKGGSLKPPDRATKSQVPLKLHWEVDYTVAPDGKTNKDFELSG